jgi:PadR family transcriptional regulator PadR
LLSLGLLGIVEFVEPIKGHLDSLLLGVLADGPLHGYAIIDRLKHRSSGRFDLPEGTVYPALHRLEEAGLLESRWANAGARRRRVYRLTRRGRRSLGERRREWEQFARAVEAVLA